MDTKPATDVFLQPGEYFVGDADCRIRTLLGSCVSMTLWHPGKRIGAMSHCVLATRHGPQAPQFDGRYADEALALMLQELARLQIGATACQAKLFGGGDMFSRQPRRDRAHPVGRQKGEAVRRLLQAHRIPIVSESLFGKGHRQIIFEVRSGHVWSRQIKPTDGLWSHSGLSA